MEARSLQPGQHLLVSGHVRSAEMGTITEYFTAQMHLAIDAG
jgi:hypothetical protein